MHVSRTWRVLCVLGFVSASLCVNEVDYEGNYADNYDNEISQDQQEGETPTPSCQTAEFSRWDKLFIALEDSHMRQNMLLESLEQCCGGMNSVRTQVDKLAQGTCQQAEQASVRLQKSLLELREEEAQREMRLNSTLQQLLHSSREGSAHLKRLEEAIGLRVVLSAAGDSRVGHQPTQKPGGLGAAFGLGVKPLPSGFKEQEVTSPLDMAGMEKALVAVAAELQRVQLQLSRMIEQAGTQRKSRGDT